MRINKRQKATFLGLWLAALMFVPIDTGSDTFFWGPIFDAGHYPIFLLFTFLLAWLLPSSFRQVPTILLNPYFLATTICLSVEAIQPLVDRSGSFTDISYGLLGIAAAGVLRESWKTSSPWKNVLLVLCLFSLFIVLLSESIPGFKVRQWRSNSFPQLASFSHPAETWLWQPIYDHDYSRPVSARRIVHDALFKAQRALEVSTSNGHWSGVHYLAGDKNWSGFRKLAISVFNPEPTEIELHLRIDDSHNCRYYDQRFNTVRVLSPGKNLLEISTEEIKNGPGQRELDLTRIRRLSLFFSPEAAGKRFYVEEMLLKP